MYHARCAIRLDSNDRSLKEYLLLLYEIPDKLIGEKEAIQIARDIIRKEPNSIAALRVLNRISD